MTDTSFVQQEIIDASTLNPGELRCPRCKGDTLVLSGQAQIEQREIMEHGVITDRQPNTKDAGSFDVTRIDCVPCTKTFHLRSPKLFALERENSDLKFQVGELMRKVGEVPEGGPGSLGAEYGFRN